MIKTPPPFIDDAERLQRIDRLRERLDAEGLAGILLGSTESLRYFTGLSWHPSERFLGALITRDTLTYIVPGFEVSRVETLSHLPGGIASWEEDEAPAILIAKLLGANGRLALDERLPLFVFQTLAGTISPSRLADGGPTIAALRVCKSQAEIALIGYAMNLTAEVQRRAYAFMRPGIRASEAISYIDEQHRVLGAASGSSFCIVSFGTATAMPHGADGDQTLEPGQPILVDTGTRIDGYHSDLTRTYMLDEPTAEFARIWTIEREAQQAVFDAAKIGASCASLDAAARSVLTRHGLGPDYRLPGLPHRAGHGLGLEIHEEPYIVRGNETKLAVGMCFSNEPMIVIPGQFGVRLEDHIYMAEDGPRWFTQPASGPSQSIGGK